MVRRAVHIPAPMLFAPLAALLFAGSGCVTVYQPLTSLQRPVVVDVHAANFDGTHVMIRCVPSDDFPADSAELLCRNVGTLFRNQGAQVDQEVPRDAASSRFNEEAKKPDLVMDIRSRLLHHYDSSLLAVLYVVTLTIVPTVEEDSFAQDVTIRDSSGSLLASDSMQARFVKYSGVGVWGINALADLVRAPEDKLTGDVANQTFSRDFYGQLSQLAFNARVRSQVLHGFQPAAPPPGEEPGAPPPAQDPARLDEK